MDPIQTLKTYIRTILRETPLDGFAGSQPHNSPGNLRYDVAIYPKSSGDEEFDVDYEPEPELKNDPYLDKRHPFSEGRFVRRAACVLIVSDDGKILAVSRKDDPTAFGMPGGKVDPGEEPIEAAERELQEETGLIVTNLRQVFVNHDGDSECYTFVGTISGEIDTHESGVIRWVEPHVLLMGPFGDYNRQLFTTVGLG